MGRRSLAASGELRLGRRTAERYNAHVVTTIDRRETHYRPRPLPEPERSKHVSAVGQAPTDDLGKLLEQWLQELRGGYTIAGE